MSNNLQTSLKFLVVTIVISTTTAQFNPSILQDSRNEPKLDGTFGFLYRTEDGISHAAKADPGGIVHGRFTYTDPTGLKVNYNYNAGSAVTPNYNYNAIQAATPAPVYSNQGQVQEDRRTRPPALQQQQYQPVAQQPLIQPVYQQPVQQPIQQPVYQQQAVFQQQPQPVYQQQQQQQQGFQHPLANLQQDPYLPEDDGSYHPELDAQYEYHDSDNNVNVNFNNNYPVPVYRQ